MSYNIKRSVSLYSYQEEYYLGKMTLEDCIREAAKAGATGIELLPEQMMDDFPVITPQFKENWFGWMEKYGTEPTCYDAFLENHIYKNRTCTLKEQIGMMERDIRLAHELGFKTLRTLVSTPMDVIEGSIPYAEANDIMKIGEGVRKAFEEILVPAGMGDIALYTELGRYMLAPFGHLVTKAIHEKHIYKEYIGLDACAVNLMRPAMYGAYHHITVMGKETKPCDHKYDVTGSLCENNDKFAIDRMLPKIDLGDFIVIHDTGAHGFAMGYNYNGKLRSAELLLKEDQSVQLIRRAETPKDYFATFDFCDIFQNVES
jgi:hypothetical protein